MGWENVAASRHSQHLGGGCAQPLAFGVTGAGPSPWPCIFFPNLQEFCPWILPVGPQLPLLPRPQIGPAVPLLPERGLRLRRALQVRGTRCHRDGGARRCRVGLTPLSLCLSVHPRPPPASSTSRRSRCRPGVATAPCPAWPPVPGTPGSPLSPCGRTSGSQMWRLRKKRMIKRTSQR